ncbi:AAA family ATPase [Bacteroidia bacterium]|mgnify:FL=1|jgi:MoxR-like ATPase|nr:AAA family ATPase [Bacteroidia bacterium]|tara:strand:- start:304 stop:1269 length:966 start_codon:yes stop_codon:yes gene_type:complete
MIDFADDKKAADDLALKVQELKAEIGKVIIGQHDVINGVITSIISNGHALLIGVPGLAKTLLIKTISEALDMSFNRIQFTPDLMPSDILGSEILDDTRNFKFNKGPVFANIVLADEINRTPPKTQAALLEAMQEKTVTISGTEYILPKPFFVLATQNPIEQEGTYPLPEAQLDRFMFNMVLDYPTTAEEISIVKATTGHITAPVNKVVSQEEIIGFQNLVRKVEVADNVYEYAVKLVGRTRANRELATPHINEYIEYGAGPRASQYLIVGAKANALINGKYSPDIEDVQAVAKMVLRHRVVRNYKAEAENISADSIIESIF